MPEIAIVGAGLAGLSAAVALSSKGYKVRVFESSQRAGGRASSFSHKIVSPLTHSENHYRLDNGQHIMMGCYHETLSFLDQISSINKIYIQDQLEVKMITSDQTAYLLRSGSLYYPFNLLQALLGFNLLTFRQKLSAIKFINRLKSVNLVSLENISVKNWLDQEGQTGMLYLGLWEILCVGTLNTPPEKSAASIFAEILRIIFLGGKENSKIVISEVNLSELFVEPAIDYIHSRGGKVEFSTLINRLDVVDSDSIKLFSRDNLTGNFSDVILAIPHHALKKIAGVQQYLPSVSDSDMEYSSITTFHLFLKENSITDKFLSFIGSPVQWVFNHGDYITTVTSSSSAWDTMSEQDIIIIVLSELKKYLGIEPENILTHKMVKEKRATFICGGENLKLRLNCKTLIPDLQLAGDWTATGLPATIEGAVLSGKTAAMELITKYSKITL